MIATTWRLTWLQQKAISRLEQVGSVWGKCKTHLVQSDARLSCLTRLDSEMGTLHDALSQPSVAQGGTDHRRPKQPKNFYACVKNVVFWERTWN